MSGKDETRGGSSGESGRIIVVMGVAGAGKTTVAQMLAEQLGWEWIDADDVHPLENIERMSAGIPLTEIDRRPWLEQLRRVIAAKVKDGPLVLACSALTRAFRQLLAADFPRLIYVYLRVPESALLERLASRRGHFMRADLLSSQLEVLEEPVDGDEVVVVDVGADESPDQVVTRIRQRLGM
jgi:carbohydrate kinase (thermoresistant glucokinase family)